MYYGRSNWSVLRRRIVCKKIRVHKHERCRVHFTLSYGQADDRSDEFKSVLAPYNVELHNRTAKEIRVRFHP